MLDKLLAILYYHSAEHLKNVSICIKYALKRLRIENICRAKNRLFISILQSKDFVSERVIFFNKLLDSKRDCYAHLDSVMLIIRSLFLCRSEVGSGP